MSSRPFGTSMSDEVGDNQDPEFPEAGDFTLHVAADTSCAIEFFSEPGGPLLATVALSADLADALAGLLRPEARHETFGQASEEVRSSLH